MQEDITPFASSFSSQLLLSDLHVHKDSIQIGKYYFRTLTLKNLPEGYSFASMVDGLLKGLPFHFWLSQSIEILDQKKEMEKLQLARRLAHSMASGAKNVSDLESESKLHHLESLISELLEGSQKIVSMDFNILVWGKDFDELESRCDEVLQAYRNMGQSEGIIETLPALDSFISCTPGSAIGFRHKKLKSSNCSHLMPVYSYWKGNNKPVCLFQNRDGGLFSFDPFAPELQNWNALIFGGSGAGKSFSILQIMLQFYGQNPTPRIVWIDNGASSKRLLEKSVLDGQFIDLNLDSDICLNMFDLPKEDRVPTPSKIKLILAILETILKDDEQIGLPKRHKALIEEAIYMAYENKAPEMPTLSDLKNVFSKHENIEMRNYAQVLYSWTGETAYGRLLDGKTNINLDKDLITIEIKGLDTYPDLQNAMLLNFTEFIKATAAKDTSRPTLLIIDEAWKLFETPSGRSFTIEAYRTFRKFGGGAGIWCISQNYKDFLISDEISNAIFPNTTSILVLKQSKIDWEDFMKRLQLNEAELEVAKSLQSVKGEYSELFLMQNNDRVVLRVQADPLAYFIATTDPADNRMISKLEQEKPELNKIEILQILADQKFNNKQEVDETI